MKTLLSICALAVFSFACSCTDATPKDPVKEAILERYLAVATKIGKDCGGGLSDTLRARYSRSLKVSTDSADSYISFLSAMADRSDCLEVRRYVSGKTKEDEDRLVIDEIKDAIAWVKSFKPGDCIDGAQSVINGANRLGTYADLAVNYQSSDVKGIKKEADALAAQVVSWRRQNFPALRKRWADFADKTMWESNIDVKTLGGRATTLELVGGTFASNANIGEAQRAISDAVTLLRFKRVNYRWYGGASEYQYFSVDSKDDSAR